MVTAASRRKNHVDPRPRRKSLQLRTVRLALPPFAGNPGLLDITVGTEAVSYYVRPLAGDFGRGFELEKLVPDEGEASYQVCVDVAGGRHTCTCRGWCRWSHCKHTASLSALVARGSL